MDSGIESTESSNGSSSDTCSNMVDVQSNETHNYSNTANEVSEETSQNCSQEYCFREPCTVGLSSSKNKKNKSDSEMNSNNNFKDKSTNSVSNSMPSASILPLYLESQKYYWAKDSSELYSQKISIPNDIFSKIDSDKGINDSHAEKLSIPRETSSKPELLVQIPRLPVPEGCCLKLNFPKIETELPLVHEQVTPFENFTAHSFATGPLQINYNQQPYTGSLAVLPYESRELQRKFKHYRRRLRQLISTKPKERKLRTAASLNNVELVEKLLKEGVDSKAVDEKDRTALHIAASKGFTDVVKLLLHYGADPNQKDSIGNTALHLAACTSHIETVILLLKSGTNVKQADNQGYSPLHLAYSRLKLLQKDPNPSSDNLRTQVYQIVEMMQEYLKRSGNTEEAELLTALTNQLSLSDSSSAGEEDIKQLLNSLQDLTLSKTKND